MTKAERKRAYNTLRLVVPRGPYKRAWLHWWVVTYLGVWIPAKKVCPDHVAPFTAFADAFFNETVDGTPIQTVVCKASRLFGGKTYLSAVLGLTRAILLRAEIKILGGSKEQATNMQDYLTNTDEKVRGRLLEWPNAPHNLVSQLTRPLMRFHNGASVQVLAASEKSTRGKHPTDLFVDEADECEWAVFSSALGTNTSSRGIKQLTFITSTEQNADGTFAAVLDMAESREGWIRREWCFRETHEDVGGHNTEEQIRQKKSDMTEMDWQNEVELQRPESGDLIFSQGIIDLIFNDSLGSYDDRMNGDVIMPHPPDEPGASYYHGVDWGKERDATVILTMREFPGEPDTIACYQRIGRRPWPEMLKMAEDQVKLYGGPAYHDETGLGDTLDDFMRTDMKGWNFARRRETEEAYSSYVVACENGEYLYPNLPHFKKVHSRLTRKQLVTGKAHVPDEIAACMLARKAKLEGSFTLLLGGV